MTVKYLLLLGCLTLNSANASDYLVGDSCTIGDINFEVITRSPDFVELSSSGYDLVIGSTKIQSICTQSQLKAIKDRRILWVGKR